MDNVMDNVTTALGATGAPITTSPGAQVGNDHDVLPEQRTVEQLERAAWIDHCQRYARM